MAKFLRYKPITLGELTAHQFTLFEFKSAFSIIFYFFKGSGWQDRFHTHAFNALSIKIFGTYVFREMINDEVIERRRREFIRFFPKSTNHMLGPSTGCLTVLFSGPWEKSWTETKNSRVRTIYWGRKTKYEEIDNGINK